MVGLLPRPAEPRLDRLAVAFGEMIEHVALLVLDAALHGHAVAEHLPDGLPEGLDPSITNSMPCSTSRPRSTRSASSAAATVAFSVEPPHSPSASFSPSVVIP